MYKISYKFQVNRYTEIILAKKMEKKISMPIGKTFPQDRCYQRHVKSFADEK